MQKTVAVTGASGHIGNVLCRKLIESGYSVKAYELGNKKKLVFYCDLYVYFMLFAN